MSSNHRAILAFLLLFASFHLSAQQENSKEENTEEELQYDTRVYTTASIAGTDGIKIVDGKG